MTLSKCEMPAIKDDQESVPEQICCSNAPKPQTGEHSKTVQQASEPPKSTQPIGEPKPGQINKLPKSGQQINESSNSNQQTSESPKCTQKTEEPPKPAVQPVKVIRIGTRKSKLALIQAEFVRQHLDDQYNGQGERKFEFKLVPISTKGDKILDVPLANIGSKALFTKELEVALIENEIDLIVHSCKDLPTNLPPGLCISAILSREIADDVLVVKRGLEHTFKSVSDFLQNHHKLFEDKAIGTSSLRRVAQLRRINSQIKIEDIRGNIDTRLSKLDAPDSPYSALVLAGAGLRRGGYESRITAALDQNWWYAVGQGALAVECREGDEYTQGLLHRLIDERTTFRVIAERSFMQYLEGGCSIPLGVRSEFLTVESEPRPASKTDTVEDKADAKSDDLEAKKGDAKNAKENDKKNGAKEDAKENDTKADVKTNEVSPPNANQTNEVTEPDAKQTNEVTGPDAKQTNEVSEPEAKGNQTSKEKEAAPPSEPKRSKAHLDAIANLHLSGVVISLDGQKCVQFDCKLQDVDLDSMEDSRIDCTKIVLPTSGCPIQSEVKEQYISCAKLGIHLAKQLQALGAKSILDEINKSRKPVSD